MDEEALCAGADDAFLCRMPCQCRNDAVDVRMVLELATPGMQDAGEAGLGAFGFSMDHVAQGCGASLEDEAVHFPGMGEAGLA